MGYTKINDPAVRDGYSKFRFDLRLNEVRYRKIITCRRSVVNVLYREWEDKIYAGRSKQNYRFFEILDNYLEHVKVNKSPNAYQNELRTIKRFKLFFNKNLILSEFKRSLVDDYVSWRRVKVFSKHDNSLQKGQVTNATINRDLACLSSFFTYCIRREYINTINPIAMCKLKENNEREVRLSRAQLEEFLNKAQAIDSMLYNVIAMALLTGMRRKEIFSLEWSEVHFDNSIIILSARKTKSKKSRIVPVTPTARDILLSMSNDTHLVVGHYTSDMLRKQWKKLLNSVTFGKIGNGTDLHFHDLRHVYAQTLLDQGVGLEDIQSLLGHEDFKTTQKRYAMFARPDLQNKAGLMDNVVKLRRVV